MPTGVWSGLEGLDLAPSRPASESILNYILQPSPLQAPHTLVHCAAPQTACGAGAPAAAIALDEVEQLAGMGLTLPEILASLGHWAPLPEPLRGDLELAVARGRAKGSARIKEAYYNLALEGALSAQKHMLDLLTDVAEPARKGPLRVVRKILE